MTAYLNSVLVQITESGRVAIPEEIIKAVGTKVGGVVSFVLDGQNVFIRSVDEKPISEDQLENSSFSKKYASPIKFKIFSNQ